MQPRVSGEDVMSERDHDGHRGACECEGPAGSGLGVRGDPGSAERRRGVTAPSESVERGDGGSVAPARVRQAGATVGQGGHCGTEGAEGHGPPVEGADHRNGQGRADRGVSSNDRLLRQCRPSGPPAQIMA